MCQDKRPAPVTAIGWAVLFFGGIACLCVTINVFTSVLFEQVGGLPPEVPLVVKIVPLFGMAQLFLAEVLLVSGINLLSPKAWARYALEGLYWLLLVSNLGLMIFGLYKWIEVTVGHSPLAVFFMGALMILANTGLLAVPLGLLLMYIRSPKVRNAMGGEAE